MASLKFIMDVDDDHPVDSRHTTKKDKDPGTPTTTGPLPPLAGSSTSTSASTSNHRPLPGHVSSSSARPVEQKKNISSTAPTPQTNTRGLLSRDPELTNTNTNTTAGLSTTLRSLTPSSSTHQASNPRPPARRRSTTSIDSMDHTGYGSAASSSSMGAGLHHHHHHNNPMRPMPAHQAATDLPMRLTPITGRVSRAKKGVPVHVCDICRPAKTFTRAEHLRRHQLSHQNPGHACNYPGCDRTFHRPDLLARHQQRHEQEGDKVSSKGGNEDDGRASSAPSSIDDRYSQRASSHQQAQAVASPNMPASSLPSAPATSNAPVPSTPHAPGHQRRVSQRSNPPMGGSPNPSVSTYRPPGGTPGDYQHYPLPASTVGLIDPINSSAMGGGFGGAPGFEHMTTTPPPVSSTSQGVRRPIIRIPDNGTPDLYHARDASPWTSSASDSTYSTPVSDMPAQTRLWLSTRSPTTADWPSSQLLSPYPGTAPRDPRHQAGDSMTAPPPPLFLNPYGSSAQYGTDTQQSFGAMFDVSMASLQPGLNASTDRGFHSHQRQSSSISSIRSATPPPIVSSHGGETLVAPPMALPSRLGSNLARRKTLLNGHQMPDTQADMTGIGPLDGLGSGFGGMDVHEDQQEHGSGLLATMGLSMNSGCTMPVVAMPMALPRSVQAVIPHYIEVYWARVHPRLPLVHRPSFEAAPEDVLRCAMAAVASQYISAKEDRGRGNQLHEYAWQEAKRQVTQWSLQTMQAIFLCEYFARFRGRKTATKPSKLFESLYSRVSSLEFFAAACSVPLGSHDNALWPVDPSAWSSSPSSFSDCSSCDSITPTAATVSSYPNTFPDASTPWGSFPSSYASSTSSYGNGSMLSPSPFPPDVSLSSNDSTIPASFNPGLTHGPNHNSVHPSAPHRQGQQRTWSSLFSPGRYNPPLASPFSFHAQSHLAEQTYSQALATLQVLYNNPSAFDPSAPDSSLSANNNTDRWHAWVDSEARRRLLAACFHLDSHAALLQQQRRAHDYTNTTIPPPPLFARSAPLWSAPSSQSWAAALASDPDAGMPAFSTAPITTTPQDPFDHMAVLATEMLKLPQDGEEARIAALFRACPVANTYLALHHTPLRDLLAVGGDSWVFAKKVVSETSFAEHQRRLRVWVDAGAGAARATVYAARAIVGFVDRGEGVDGDLSDYWALYVCALICWAGGHRHRGRQQQQGGGGVGEEVVMGWLRGVAGTEEGVGGGAVLGRREAAGVVGVVRRRLEGGGGAGRLFVDAVGVLRRVEEGGGGQGGWRWF
ncbi:putative transcription factor TDA9 [Podospora conica]|nr:putative transcription factor TDA9 [Schizothecium conicum]